MRSTNVSLVALDIQIVFDSERNAIKYTQRLARLPSPGGSLSGLSDQLDLALREGCRVRAAFLDIAAYER